MGDMAEVWEGYAERSKIKRASNRANSAKTLQTFGIEYTTHNFGAHLIINCGEQVIDFWPGTGKWIVRGKPTIGRGVMKLVKYHQAQTKEQP